MGVRAWVAVLGLLLALPAQAAVLAAVKDRNEYPLGPHMDLFEDDSAELTIGAIGTALYDDRFVPVRSERPGYGFRRSALWFRMTLDLSAVGDRQWYLVETHPILDDIAVYFPNGRGGWDELEMGDTLPFGRRLYQHREFIFPVPAALARSPEPFTVYVRVAGKGALNVDLRLTDAQGLVERTNTGTWVFGLFYGALLVMLFYNLLLWFAVRDRSQAYYLAFLGGYLLLFLSLNGFGLQYLWPQLPAVNGWFPLFSCVAMWGALQFARVFLDVRAASPRTDTALRWMTHAVVVAFVLALVLPRHVAYVLGTLLPLFFAVVLLVSGFLRLRQGYGPARLFVAGWGFMLLGALLLPLANFGLLPINNFTFYANQVGAVLLVVMLSLALGERMKLLKQEGERIEREARRELEQLYGQLQRLDSDKMRFLHYLSHELNTPLNWVGAVRGLEPGTAAVAGVAEAVAAVEKGQQRMTDLVSTVLGYFDLAGEDPAGVTVTTVAPMWVVEALLRERAGQVAARKLQVRAAVPAELAVLANEKRLRRVLGLLLDNAIQFSSEGGTIEVTGGLESYGTRGFISVRDAGRGIGDEQLAGLFEPFFMVGSQHREEGFGLSLPTARLLVRSMGGEIRARSEGRGHGAEFTVSLPVAADNASRATPLGRAETAGSPPT